MIRGIATFIIAGIMLHVAGTVQAQDTVRFSEGLMLSGPGGLDRSSLSTDPVTWSVIMGSLPKPEAGATAYTSSQGSEMKWEKITPGEDGYFSNGSLRGGLYLEYSSPSRRIMLLEVSGNTLSVVNGIPLEGDHYDFGYSLRPVTINKGKNTLWLTGGRFQRIKVMFVAPSSDIMLTAKDLTLPDLVYEEPGMIRYGGVQVVNATAKDINGYTIRCTLNGNTEITTLPVLSRENTVKLPFGIPAQGDISGSQSKADVVLCDPAGREVSRIAITLRHKHFREVHDRTFISAVDGSVQYFSVTPGGTDDPGEGLFLSVHGAGVEARNQARAYKPKSWGDVVAATNRRPYGFAWEDWGRLDALEVLEEGKKLFKPDPSRIYLSGHSMGGHGTWYLGATYPSMFAAIAPCAGYADLLGYASRPAAAAINPAAEMMLRAGNPTRTKTLARNYIHHGVYVFHGDADETVSVAQARDMRALLGTFHPDFAYKEYPGGTHWWSDEALDWPPIFEFFRIHQIPKDKDVVNLEFHTANPGVSATSHYLTVEQQERPLLKSSVSLRIDTAMNRVSVTTENISLFCLDLPSMPTEIPFEVTVDSTSVLQITEMPGEGKLWLERSQNKWDMGEAIPPSEKNPLRNGTFKDAFRNRMVFVYGTGGTPEEDAWIYSRARLDASTFGYRGNGTVELIADTRFSPERYADRNIILYGNYDNNSAWSKVLESCPVEVASGYIKVGERRMEGDDMAIFFIWPRADSDIASVGVVGGTGLRGMKGGYGNQYFNSGSAFPDLTVVKSDAGKRGYEAVVCTGFFDNQWGVENGEFVWSLK